MSQATLTSTPTLLRIRDIAARLGCSTKHITRLRAAGAMPRPLEIGALLRWDPNVVEDWIKRGCPRSQED
jgi:predicted DNA-binding transcriptional regulator AlpA